MATTAKAGGKVRKKPRPAAKRIPKRRPGRPRVADSHLDDAFKALAAGMTLTAFCKQPGRPTRVRVVDALNVSAELRERFRVAREAGFDAIAEQVMELADEPLPGDDKVARNIVQQRKLQCDVRLRLLSKWCTARYGDRVQLAGDPAAPLMSLTPDQVRAELLAMLARARARQLAGEAPPVRRIVAEPAADGEAS